MILFMVIFLVMLSLMIFPFMMARASFNNLKHRSLIVKNDNIRDPRYFAKAFTQMMDHALDIYDGSGTIRLSKDEQLSDADALPPSEVCDTLVYAKTDLRPLVVREFKKEIYCKGSAVISADTTLRAIACKRALTLLERCTIIRWVDGVESIRVESGCDLGVSASSVQQLFISPCCQFLRLYAPEIHILGGVKPSTELTPTEETIHTEFEWDLSAVEDDERIERTVICHKNFVVGQRAQILGSMKGHKCIHVKRGASITGNLIANGDIILEGDVYIGGIVFSQRCVYIGPGCQIGRSGKIKSAIAKESLVLAENVQIYGYASCDHGGQTVNAEVFLSLISDKY
ncbi:MAG: hypothetical protein RRZ24_01000 [Clostridia bacterium]